MEFYLGGALAGFIMGAVDIGFMVKNKFTMKVEYGWKVWLMSFFCLGLNVVFWPIVIIATCVSQEQTTEKIIREKVNEKIRAEKYKAFASVQTDRVHALIKQIPKKESN